MKSKALWGRDQIIGQHHTWHYPWGFKAGWPHKKVSKQKHLEHKEKSSRTRAGTTCLSLSIQPEEKKKSKSEHRDLVECKENGIKSDIPFNESCSPIDRPHLKKQIIKKPNTLCSNYHLFVPIPLCEQPAWKHVCVSTYSLRGGLRCHAVFADGQSESVFHPCFQLGAGDSQHRTTGSQAKVQTGAVLCTLSVGVRPSR